MEPGGHVFALDEEVWAGPITYYACLCGLNHTQKGGEVIR